MPIIADLAVRELIGRCQMEDKGHDAQLRRCIARWTLPLSSSGVCILPAKRNESDRHLVRPILRLHVIRTLQFPGDAKAMHLDVP